MNIEELESSAAKTFDVVVGHAADTKEPVGFRVVGPFSDQYEVVNRRQQIRNIATHRQRASNETPATEQEQVEQIAKLTEQHAHDLAMTCTVGWFGFSVAGAEAEFTSENLKRVLNSRKPWVDKIANAVNTEANFS